MAPLLHIPVGPEKVQQHPELLRVEIDRQGIDGEVPAVKVHLDGAVFHDGQGPRGIVILGAGRGHIDFEAVREDNHRGLEFLEDPGPGPVAGGKGLGKGDAVTFDDQVHVQIILPDEQVPDKPPHHVSLEPLAPWPPDPPGPGWTKWAWEAAPA